MCCLEAKVSRDAIAERFSALLKKAHRFASRLTGLTMRVVVLRNLLRLTHRNLHRHHRSLRPLHQCLHPQNHHPMIHRSHRRMILLSRGRNRNRHRCWSSRCRVADWHRAGYLRPSEAAHPSGRPGSRACDRIPMIPARRRASHRGNPDQIRRRIVDSLRVDNRPGDSPGRRSLQAHIRRCIHPGVGSGWRRASG